MSDPETPGPEDLAHFWRHGLAMMGVGNYDGYFVLLNAAYPAVLGWSQEELMSVHWWEFLHPAEQDGLLETAQQLMTDGRTRFSDDIRMLRRDGHYKWIRWNTAADTNRQLFYSVGFDISDWRVCQDWIHVGSWDWRVRTQTAEWSPELFDMFALAPTIVSYPVHLQSVHADDRARVQQRIQDSLTTGEPFTDDFRVVDGNGIRWLHSAGRALRDQDGGVYRMRGITMDITDRRHREATPEG